MDVHTEEEATSALEEGTENDLFQEMQPFF